MFHVLVLLAWSRSSVSGLDQDTTPKPFQLIDGFRKEAPTFCTGSGENVSKKVENTVEACSARCRQSMTCMAFYFSPTENNHCMLYHEKRQRGVLHSLPRDAVCYVRKEEKLTGRRLEGLPCEEFNPCPSPEKCEVGSNECIRTYEARKQVLSLVCANNTVPPFPVLSLRALQTKNKLINPTPIPISQRDFVGGGYEITKPGTYVFQEDIVIPLVYEPLNQNPPRQLGQTIGIYVLASDVIIDFNGHSLSMSDELRKRDLFMDLIQLNTGNFNEGTIGYGPQFNATNVVIYSSSEKPGVIEKSTHFGIAGINNRAVIIKNLEIRECEIGGISLVDVQHVLIEDVLVDNRDLKVPYTPYYAGLLQASRRLSQIVNILGQDASLSTDSVAVWQQRLDAVEKEIAGADTNWLANPEPDRPLGNSYGIQIKNMINEEDNGGRNVRIINCEIRGIRSGPKDVDTINDNTQGELKDADFSAFEFADWLNEDGTMKPMCNQAEPKCAMNHIRLQITLFLCSLPAGGRPVGVNCVQTAISALLDDSQTTTTTVAPGRRPRPGRGSAAIRRRWTIKSPSDIRVHNPRGAFGVRLIGVFGAILHKVKVVDVESSEKGKRFTRPVKNFRTVPLVFRQLQDEDKIFEIGHCAFGIYFRRCQFVNMTLVTAQKIKSKFGIATGIAGTKSSTHMNWKRVTVHVETPTPGDPVELPAVTYNMPYYLGKSTIDCLEIAELHSLAESNELLPGEEPPAQTGAMVIIGVVLICVFIGLYLYMKNQLKPHH